jgi:hypothetical protein
MICTFGFAVVIQSPDTVTGWFPARCNNRLHRKFASTKNSDHRRRAAPQAKTNIRSAGLLGRMNGNSLGYSQQLAEVIKLSYQTASGLSIVLSDDRPGKSEVWGRSWCRVRNGNPPEDLKTKPNEPKSASRQKLSQVIYS